MYRSESCHQSGAEHPCMLGSQHHCQCYPSLSGTWRREISQLCCCWLLLLCLYRAVWRYQRHKNSKGRLEIIFLYVGVYREDNHCGTFIELHAALSSENSGVGWEPGRAVCDLDCNMRVLSQVQCVLGVDRCNPHNFYLVIDSP